MDDKGLLEQLKKYQHQNKNLLSENAKLHAKSKRLKMEKKQLKIQLQTQMQQSTENIATKTLEFVNHHQIEMQKMIVSLLNHPTIMKSSTHKDLQYISSKLAYIQSKVSLLTNGKTISSPPHLHSNYSQRYTNYKSATANSITIDTESDSSFINIPITNKKRNKYTKQRQHAQHPTVHNLASRSSPHMQHKMKRDFDAYNDTQTQSHSRSHSKYHKRMQSHPESLKSLQQQLRQLDLDKYLNKSKTHSQTLTHTHSVESESINSENNNILPLTQISNSLILPLNKQRSAVLSTSSMNVSRATSTSIMEDMENDLNRRMHTMDNDIPSLPPSPINSIDNNNNNKPHSRNKIGKIPQHMPYIPSPTSSYYDNNEHVNQQLLSPKQLYNCNVNTTTTRHKSRANMAVKDEKIKYKSKNKNKNKSKGNIAYKNRYATNKSNSSSRYSSTASIAKKNNKHRSSRSVALKNSKSNNKFDVKHVSMKLQDHVNVHKETQLNSRNQTPTPPPTNTENNNKRNKRQSHYNSHTTNVSTVKSNSVILQESPVSNTIGATSDTNNTFSPLSYNLLKKYNERTHEKSDTTVSISTVNFVYEFNHTKQDSMNSFPTVTTPVDINEPPYYENNKITTKTKRRNSKHVKSKTFQDHLNSDRDRERTHQNVNIKGSVHSSTTSPNTPNNNSFTLEIDAAPLPNSEKTKSKTTSTPKNHSYNNSKANINNSSPPIPENAENISTNWQFNQSYSPANKNKLQPNKPKSITANHPKSKSVSKSISLVQYRDKKRSHYLEKPIILSSHQRNNSSASSSSSNSNSSSSSSTSTDIDIESCNSNNEKKEIENSTDGESDDYYDSSTELNEYSVGTGREGTGENINININTQNSKKKPEKTYKIDVSAVNCEGIGGGDDFFDSTNGTRSPFKLANNEKNMFTPSALSPYGFLAHRYGKDKRSHTVSAMDMYSNKKKIQKKNSRYSSKKRHQNGSRKHNSFTYIDYEKEEKYAGNLDVEQIKKDMLDQYQQQNMRRDSIELDDHDAKTRTLTNIEEEKKEVLSPRSGHNYLSPPTFLSDSDGNGNGNGNGTVVICRMRRRLSLEEKQKLLVIDDLIASILEDKNSYLMTNALLLSYQAFTSSLLLMKVLRRRFRVPHDYVDRQRIKSQQKSKNNHKQRAFNAKTVAFKIQLGICQLIYAWMHQYWDDDFVSHPMLQKEIYDFQNDVDKFIVDKTKINVIQKLLKEPKNLSSQNALFSKSCTKSHSSSLSRSTQSQSQSQSLSQSILSHDSDSISRSASKLEDVNEEIKTRWPHLMVLNSMPIPKKFIVLNYKSADIAKQIVLMDYCVFKEIRPREVVAQAWKKNDKWEKAKNILRMINQFNSVCRWIQITIINYGKTAKHRAKMIKHMILIAQTLYEYQDFSALCAVHGALVSTPIKRLTKSWKKVSKKYIKMIQNISLLFQWNSPKLIELHSQCKGPLIPHLGIILKNVISIEESDEYKPDGTINTNKMNLLAQQIVKLNNWQLKCNKIYCDNINDRKINNYNKKFAIDKDLIVQKLLFRDFEQQININDEDIFKMTQNDNVR